MTKKSLSETDICAKWITPAVVQAGWDEETQIRREVGFTKGRIIVRGKLVTRGKAKRADYVLYYQTVPIAVIEAKDNNHAVGDGMQQALEYAETLAVPFVFSSNGDGFVFHDRTGMGAKLEVTLSLGEFPSPSKLWAQYLAWKGLGPQQEKIVLQPYYDDGSGKEPRYYQSNAINASVEAIAKGQNRVLLVMATGTGKTYTAFQIIWRLWKAGQKKRILFLADRNVLIDQTMVNDFRPFGPAMAKLSTGTKTIERADGSQAELTTAVDKTRRIDTAYEIYLGLYQAITGPEERQKLFREFSPGFFDLIVIDECHRGSAAEDSAWREILEYFSDATQIGLTATPTETEYVSNINYFGQPVYTYSLKQGIRDGFLAPYKVIKVHLDVDVEGYRPQRGETDFYGNEIEDRVYNQKDFDRTLVIDERTQRVAKWVSDYLKESGDRFQKTIVFCVDTEHAARMRQALVNENKDLVQKNDRYVMRITGNDPQGSAQIGNFIDPESIYPVIVTTSKLLSTGVDAQTCRLIVLDREIGSMTEFKQIVGRGTRVHEDSKKYYFTLVDFRKATNHFADPEFDGEPVQIYEPGEGDPETPPDDVPPLNDDDDEDPIPPEPGEDETIVDGEPPDITLPPDGGDVPRKFYVHGKPVSVLTERIEYLDEDGKLVTESLRDYSRKAIRKQYASLEQFLRRWSTAERKEVIMEELAEEGLLLGPLQEEVGKDLDPFDLICHIAFDQPPLTRRERADNVRKRDVFTKYGPQARSILEALLAKYQDEGIVSGLDNAKILEIPPFNTMGTPFQLIKQFGSRAGFENAVHELQTALYQEVA
ncbi:EcoEI R domain-containing protein [Burkholderia pseudomallei]|uniref:EcoAI/FtnUII family type I restriction enzme subunit R n=2 Tax=Burkholderia pseudomallei TaxID=28450 RepID=UPI000977571B|nr:DEAD/DEAH box helicase family protein [Burkholderia pseudomallei]OMR69104.1 restriction endonuclease [Burkholderia pseudomallei]CAJ3531206.1 EcoEI R domain-containing protein [Burkholderia pseudomallei]CAJ5044419.1 EcoEI R domain-containing protein [Burkholderia pseudomallei]CAJ5144726.1 EcoEI R domain-containing protein [Burkholderia pseudomallei]CAJ5651085.1 EcoEI R domain-containing protein [Burkholderia pseudomallei]